MSVCSKCVSVNACSLSNATSNDFVFELQPVNNFEPPIFKMTKELRVYSRKKIELKCVSRGMARIAREM